MDFDTFFAPKTKPIGLFRLSYTLIERGMVLNPNYPGVFSKQFILGGAQLSSTLNPLKIQHFNGFWKFCFYSGLDMYIKG